MQIIWTSTGPGSVDQLCQESLRPSPENICVELAGPKISVPPPDPAGHGDGNLAQRPCFPFARIRHQAHQPLRGLRHVPVVRGGHEDVLDVATSLVGTRTAVLWMPKLMPTTCPVVPGTCR